MKIVLSYAEGRSVMLRASEQLADAMMESRRHCWHRSHIYELPPIGWRRVLDELKQVAYGPKGGFKESSESLYTGIAKIAGHVGAHEAHPAFNGMGIVGASGEIIEAFERSDGTSPYPPGRFVTLVPEHLVQYGRTLTVWYPKPWYSAEEALEREHFHQLFAL